MHPSSLFHTDDLATRAIIAENPLATIAANGKDGPVIAVLPLVWSEDGSKLIGHVGRSNPFWRSLQDTTPNISAVFQAEQVYVSASAYPSKAEHGRVVPTWNYIAAEARGTLKFLSDPVDIRSSVAHLSDRMEADREVPWAVSDAPENYIDQLINAIIAFEICVSFVRGVKKLSQNKTSSERAGVLADLAGRPDGTAMIKQMEQVE
ncbi:MAG: FMN-binding negative transcriptional regulator [Pseudomonadota bacterium]